MTYIQKDGRVTTAATDAPERLWIEQTMSGYIVVIDPTSFGLPEYVRAAVEAERDELLNWKQDFEHETKDKHEQLVLVVAERDRLRAALEIIRDGRHRCERVADCKAIARDALAEKEPRHD